VLAATQNELSHKISVRWLGHASSVQPAATKHPVHLFFSFSTLLFSSVLKMKLNLVQNVLQEYIKQKVAIICFVLLVKLDLVGKLEV
jgi:hypothetical protein